MELNTALFTLSVCAEVQENGLCCPLRSGKTRILAQVQNMVLLWVCFLFGVFTHRFFVQTQSNVRRQQSFIGAACLASACCVPVGPIQHVQSSVWCGHAQLYRLVIQRMATTQLDLVGASCLALALCVPVGPFQHIQSSVWCGHEQFIGPDVIQRMATTQLDLVDASYLASAWCVPVGPTQYVQSSVWCVHAQLYGRDVIQRKTTTQLGFIFRFQFGFGLVSTKPKRITKRP